MQSDFACLSFPLQTRWWSLALEDLSCLPSKGTCMNLLPCRISLNDIRQVDRCFEVRSLRIRFVRISLYKLTLVRSKQISEANSRPNNKRIAEKRLLHEVCGCSASAFIIYLTVASPRVAKQAMILPSQQGDSAEPTAIQTYDPLKST